MLGPRRRALSGPLLVLLGAAGFLLYRSLDRAGTGPAPHRVPNAERDRPLPPDGRKLSAALRGLQVRRGRGAPMWSAKCLEKYLSDEDDTDVYEIFKMGQLCEMLGFVSPPPPPNSSTLGFHHVANSLAFEPESLPSCSLLSHSIGSLDSVAVCDSLVVVVAPGYSVTPCKTG